MPWAAKTKQTRYIKIKDLKITNRDHKKANKQDIRYYSMDVIHYSFAPLILFRVPYTLDFLPYYLSIANGAGGIGIFELLVFHCFV